MSLLGVIVGGALALLLYVAFSASSVSHRRIDADERIQLATQHTRQIEALAQRGGRRLARPESAAVEQPKRARVQIEGPDPLHVPSVRGDRRGHRPR